MFFDHSNSFPFHESRSKIWAQCQIIPNPEHCPQHHHHQPHFCLTFRPTQRLHQFSPRRPLCTILQSYCTRIRSTRLLSLMWKRWSCTPSPRCGSLRPFQPATSTPTRMKTINAVHLHWTTTTPMMWMRPQPTTMLYCKIWLGQTTKTSFILWDGRLTHNSTHLYFFATHFPGHYSFISTTFIKSNESSFVWFWLQAWKQRGCCHLENTPSKTNLVCCRTRLSIWHTIMSSLFISSDRQIGV